VSGAALLTDNNEIAGCVVRNRTTASAEEVMSLGLAVQSSEILALRIDDGPPSATWYSSVAGASVNQGTRFVRLGDL
jgi:hypothetical protein